VFWHFVLTGISEKKSAISAIATDKCQTPPLEHVSNMLANWFVCLHANVMTLMFL